MRPANNCPGWVPCDQEYNPPHRTECHYYGNHTEKCWNDEAIQVVFFLEHPCPWKGHGRYGVNDQIELLRDRTYVN